MSGLDDSFYDDSFRETADNDQGAVPTRTAGTESADESPAEPMSREEYAGPLPYDADTDTYCHFLAPPTFVVAMAPTA